MTNRVVALFVLLLSVGLFFGYIDPTWSGDVATLQAAIDADDAALRSATDYRAKEQKLIADRDAIPEASRTKLSSMLPDAVDNVGLILSLKALADRSGLAISSIDAVGNTAAAPSSDPQSLGTKTNPVNSLDMNLTAVGTYSALQTFLSGVEYSERLLDVRDVKVAGSNSGLYTYQMTIRLYWLRQ